MKREAALVMVTTSFPRRGDGSEAAGSFVMDLALEVASRCPVSVVAPGPAREHETVDGIEVFRFKAPAKPLSTLRPWRPSELREIRDVMRAGEAAVGDATGHRPSVHILALWALPSGHWARKVSRATGVPYSVWTLGSDIWTLGRIPLVRGKLREVLRDADACFSDGLQLADDTARIGGRPVEFLPSTRRIDRVRDVPLKAAPPYRLLFLGRWHPNKGVDLLLEALSLLGEDDWALIESVDVCGGGPLEDGVRAGIDALRAAGRPIAMRGYLDKAAAEAAILAADWLLIPSRIESIPVVFSDAMKLRAPVVAMPTGDLRGLVGGVSPAGIVAARIDAGAYAAALSEALRSSPASYASGIDAQASRFRLDAIAGRLLALAGGSA